LHIPVLTFLFRNVWENGKLQNEKPGAQTLSARFGMRSKRIAIPNWMPSMDFERKCVRNMRASLFIHEKLMILGYYIIPDRPELERRLYCG